MQLFSLIYRCCVRAVIVARARRNLQNRSFVSFRVNKMYNPSSFITGGEFLIDGGITTGPRHSWSEDQSD